MIHYIYKVTNKVNGKYYIGKHSSEDIDYSYFGSGKLIKESVKKYGKLNFSIEIIQIFNNEEEAYAAEKLIVSKHLKNKNCYNLVDGGKGFSKVSSKMASMKAQQLGHFGFASMDKNKQKRIASKAGKKGAAINRENLTGMFSFSYEDRSKYSSFNNRDRIWITNGTIDKRIKITEKIPVGFYQGRSQVDMSKSRINLQCWNNGEINVFSEHCPDENFIQGMIKSTPTALLPWWNNGKINKRSIECPGLGFVQGRLKWKSKLVKCPHCNKEGGETAMKRHHFDNCKLKGITNGNK